MPGPLASLRILDFTTLLPGPFATMALADMGAAVVRVESPTRPDMVRFLPPYDGDTSAWHGVLNRNKRSLALDLKRPDAADVIRRLVTTGGYNIVIEQFRPGVMERLGAGYEDLRAANPALIYCALTGYGQTGPLRDRAGHDNNYLALSGALSYSGRRETGPPPLGIQVADIGGGALGALVGLLAAVVHRAATGEGQFVDISMLDMMLAWQAHLISHYLVAGETPEPEEMALNGGRVYDLYETADGRRLSVGSLEPKFWEGFCAAIDRPDLIAPGLSLDPDEQARVKAEVKAAILTRPLAEWAAVFAPLDVCVEPVLTVPEALAQPHVAARELVIDVPRLTGGAQRQIASPWRFSVGTTGYRHTGAALGAHTAEVLREAGFTETEIENYL
ncbi:MAG TPA: CaiB/BaiF CoA-transferase family protein [Promineifilum sp.]|nr:CaiB/BaiF CoA-transferase family protein [Promineifilum sp.]HRO92128.1 CaiB/BaiF CoA-transferase family protein [Promineifilum sp.]HRQ14060.1 CaiB/BaiF CoA-transferase family protein [Promineifilum sp.]